MALEREYNIPLRKEFMKVPVYKRAKKAVKAVKEFLSRHMKAEIENVKISKWLNQAILKRGVKNPPHHIKVKAVKDGEIVRAELFDLPKKALEEMKREEEKKAGEKKGKKEEKAEEKEEKETLEEKEKKEEEKEKTEILKKEIPKAPHQEAQPKKAIKAPMFRKALKK